MVRAVSPGQDDGSTFLQIKYHGVEQQKCNVLTWGRRVSGGYDLVLDFVYKSASALYNKFTFFTVTSWLQLDPFSPFPTPDHDTYSAFYTFWVSDIRFFNPFPSIAQLHFQGKKVTLIWFERVGIQFHKQHGHPEDWNEQKKMRKVKQTRTFIVKLIYFIFKGKIELWLLAPAARYWDVWRAAYENDSYLTQLIHTVRLEKAFSERRTMQG